MTLVHVKSAIAGAWVLGACIVGLASNVTSIGGWTALVGLGVLPPLVLLRAWNNPAQTLSESISEARR
jgi:hypothetical protein